VLVLFRAYHKIALAFLAITVAACQPHVRTEISTFSDMASKGEPGTVRIVAFDGTVADSLEFKYYADKVASRLAALGYTPVASQASDYIARLGYSVSRQEADRPHSRVIISGHYGYYPHSRALVLSEDTGKDFEYVRDIALSIDRVDDASAPTQIVQVKAASTGQCEHLTVVFDEMLDAVFANLMRSNGSVERVKIKSSELRCP